MTLRSLVWQRPANISPRSVLHTVVCMSPIYLWFWILIHHAAVLIRNTAPVEGGERAMRTIYLPAFQKACVEAGALSIMTAYSNYDGVPAISDSRQYFVLRFQFISLTRLADLLKDIVCYFQHIWDPDALF